MSQKQAAPGTLKRSTVLSYALGFGSGNQFISAIRGFAIKCGAALTSGILMFTLSITGYVANAPEQAPAALTGIAFVRFIVPVITAVIVILCLKIYPVTARVKEQMKGLYSEPQ